MKASSFNSLEIIAALSLSVSTTFAFQADPTFQASVPGPVNAVALLSDGSIVVGGDKGLAMLSSDGSPQGPFTNANAPIKSLTLAEGSILVGGRFSTLGDVPAGNIARLDASGQVSGGLLSGSVDSLVADEQGRSIVGGSFVAVNGQPATYLVRLNGAGGLDESFHSALRPSFAIEAGVTAVAVQPDGKILVGGNFETEKGSQSMVRLNPDGTLDESFLQNHGSILYVRAIVPLPSGQCYVAGQSHSGKGFVRRLNGDRSVDPTFRAPEFDNSVLALALGEDKRVVVGGEFRAPASRLTRLNVDGSLDSTPGVELSGPVMALAFDAANRLLVGGAFDRGVVRLLDGRLNSYATNDNAFRGWLRGEAGKRYVIESSIDLVHWSEFSSATGTANGLEVLDRNAATAAKRFFRARMVQ